MRRSRVESQSMRLVSGHDDPTERLEQIESPRWLLVAVSRP